MSSCSEATFRGLYAAGVVRVKDRDSLRVTGVVLPTATNPFHGPLGAASSSCAGMSRRSAREMVCRSRWVSRCAREYCSTNCFALTCGCLYLFFSPREVAAMSGCRPLSSAESAPVLLQ